MIKEELLNEKINKFIDVDKQPCINIEFDAEGVTLEALRNALYKYGNILDQSVEYNMFIASVKSGFLNSIQSLICVYLDNNKIYYKVYSSSNNIDEKYANYVVKKINKDLGINSIKKNIKNNSIFRKILFVVSIIIIAYIGIFYKLTKDYNEKVDEYNNKLIEYKDSIKESDVSNIPSFQNVLDKLDDTSYNIIDICKSMLNNNNPLKILKDIDTINSEIKKLDNNIIIVKKVTNPDANSVYNKLKNVRSIENIEIVNDEQKKSELFNYEGMFKDCIYFAVKSIEGKVSGATSVESGTDGGGCVEIYETVERAHKRYDYLMGFDNTIYYSGQFIAVGTMIVRTSYLLSDEENNELVNEIIDALIV